MSLRPASASPAAAVCCAGQDTGLATTLRKPLGRRGFLAAGAIAGGVFTFGDAVLSMTPAAAFDGANASNTLIVLSLRGGADGLSLVVPHADPAYYQARPRIGIAADKLLVKDSFFGLHPALKPLEAMWNAGKIAAIHATGMPAPNRSHFAAMDEIEDAYSGSDARVGWLNRLIGLDATTEPTQAIQIGTALPYQLNGPADALSLTNADTFLVQGAASADATDPRMASLYQNFADPTHPYARAARTALKSTNALGVVRSTPTNPNAATYAKGSNLGAAFAQAARIIRSGLGTNVLTLDYGVWDHHIGLGTVDSGAMKNAATELGAALAAFFADLGPLGEKVTVVTISEFGRRVQENSNLGLDHGYGNVMFALGAGVKGGYYAKWPGLTNSLDADLTVTTDYRHVLAEIVSKRFGVSTATVFPNFSPQSVGFMA